MLTIIRNTFLLMTFIIASCSNGGNDGALRQSIEQAYTNKQYQECVAFIDEVLITIDVQKNDSIRSLKIMKADCLCNLKQYQNCADVFSEIISDYRETPEILIKRGMSYEYIGKYDSALQDYSMVIEIFNHIDGYNQRSQIYFYLGELELSENDADSALKIDSLNNLALNNKGVCLLQRGKFDEALSFFKRSINVEKNANAYFNIGIAFDGLGVHDSACYYWNISGIKGNRIGREYYNKKCQK